MTSKPFPTHDPLDVIAQLLHDAWWAYKKEQNATHHHMKPWVDKTSYEKSQDRFQAAVILRSWQQGTDPAKLPEIIHEAWREWMSVLNYAGEKEHDRPFAVAHAAGLAEHSLQAKVVLAYLQQNIPHNTLR